MAVAVSRKRSSNNNSLLRTILIIGVIGLVFVVGGVLSFFADQASRQVPLEIEPYPGALYWGRGSEGSGWRQDYYKIPNVSPETVAAYYEQKLEEHYGNTEEGCVRIPEMGQFSASELSPGVPPYQFKCLFDRSGFQTSQFTEVVISPGLYNADPEFNTEGMTVVQLNFTWQP
jgi:hypothetical protein